MEGVRLVGLWILLVAVYAATLGIPAQTGMDYAGNEPHHLLAAESIVSDRDVDLADEYAERAYASWYPRELKTDGQIVGGRLVEPHGVGFALLIAPAYAIGGARAVQGADARAAGARVRAAARRWRGGWCPSRGRPPARRWSASRRPRWRPRRRSRPACRRRCCCRAPRCARSRSANGRGCATSSAARCCSRRCRGWAGRSSSPGAVVAWALVVWTLRERRRLAALVAGEALAASLVFYATDQRPLLRRPDAARGGLDATLPDCRSATSSGCRGSPACGWTATPGCCAGRRCSRSCSSPAGCCTARAATSSRASRRPAARPRRAPGCCWAWSARTCSSSRCFSAGGLRGPKFPGVPLVAALPAAAALTAWGLRHIPRPLGACCWRCSRSAAALWLILAERRGSLAGWLEVDTTRRGGRRSTSSRTSPASRCGPRCCARCSPPGAAALVIRERRAAGEWRRAAAASRTSRAMH